MNVHFPQDHEAAVEAEMLMAVEHQLLNAQNNRPVLGLVQDALVAAYLLTQITVFLTSDEMMQMCIQIESEQLWDLPVPAILKPKRLWTGKQAFSLLLPNLNYNKNGVVIRGGDLLTGIMDKQILGTSSGGLIHILCKIFTNRRCIDFLSDSQRVMNHWLKSRGFSIGISDCSWPGTVQPTVRKYTEHVNKVNDMGKRVGVSFEQREIVAQQLLSQMLNLAGGLVQKHMHPVKNSLMAMVKAGSKGNSINISQILGVCGQQSLQGHRIYDVHDPEQRTLSCFEFEDDSVKSRGFVENSYYSGLSVESQFFHTMAGREGIVDTSVKTADTGYLQRRLTKALEAFQVAYDGTVRDAENHLIELRYGSDDIDASHLERVNLPVLRMTNSQITRMFRHCVAEELKIVQTLSAELLRARLTVHSDVLQIESYLPVNFPCLLNQLPLVKTSSLTAETAWAILKMWEIPFRTLSLELATRWYLRSSEVLRVFRTAQELREFLGKITTRIQCARVSPGEMVGVLAAESVGHPATQLTLNTFHSAGVKEKNVTLGVPRIKELIDARKKVRSSNTVVSLCAPFSNNKEFVQVYKERVVFTTLGDVVLETQVLLEPDIHQTNVSVGADQFLLEVIRHTVDPKDYTGLNSHVIRMVLDRDQLLRKELNIRDIREILRCFLGNGKHYLLHTSETNMKVWVVRLRMAGLEEMQNQLKTQQQRREFDKNISHSFVDYLGSTVHLCGVSGIKGSAKIEHRYSKGNEDGSFTEVKDWQILTQGVNLRGLWHEPFINWQDTYCNDLFETCSVLGIEAASVVLFHEIKKVLSFDGCKINERHILSITHAMCRHGYVMPLNRHGLNKLQTGPLVRSSFEMTADMFFDAGAFGEKNPIISVSDSIMVGNRIPGGTGKCHLRLTPGYTLKPMKKEPTEKKFRVIRTYFSKFLHSHNSSNCLIRDLHASLDAIRSEPQSEPQSPEYNPGSPFYNPISPNYNPGSPIYHPASPSYAPTEVTPVPKLPPDLFVDNFPSMPSSWGRRTEVIKFVQDNGIGFSFSKYVPSSPVLPNRYSRYRPSSPVLTPTVQQQDFSFLSQRLQTLIDTMTQLPQNCLYDTDGRLIFANFIRI